jgi:hypothetical protein
MSTSFNNKTSIDAAGSRLGLYREPSEDIEDYRNRVLKALEKEFEYNKYSFRDSLDYITSQRSKSLFVIRRGANSDYVNISFDGVELVVGENKYFLEEFKFVKDFVNKLRINSNLEITYIDDSEECLYLKSSNILPFKTKREKLNFRTDRTEQVFVNEKDLKNVYDDLGKYSANDAGSEQFSSSNVREEWYVKEDGYILKEGQNEDTISYSYSDYPLVVQWNQFRYYCPNDSTFDYRIKKRVKVLAEDSEETPYILTQEGAKLVNKLYKISNTYWGK